MNIIIQNETIQIRKTSLRDVEVITAMEQEAGTTSFIMPYRQERHLQVIESKDEEHLSVFDKKGQRLAGFVILAGLENPHLSMELRRIVIQTKGLGLGRQCLQLIKKYCFIQLRFHRLWLDVFTDNQRALQLYTSEGFQLEGRLREAIKQGDQYRSLFLLSVLSHEYDTIP